MRKGEGGVGLAICPGHAGKALALAIFSLPCLTCSEVLAAEPSTVCRDEVAAAFERLKTVHYRKEVASDVSESSTAGDRTSFHGTAEFLPPDRMRDARRAPGA
jgi:hypothetical protein